MAKLVDSHCHLQMEEFDNDRQEVLGRALEQLAWLVVIGDNVRNSQVGMQMAATHPGRVFAAVGVHPHNAAKTDQGQLADIRRLLGQKGVVALGEIGLDYHYEFSPRGVQRDVLLLQLEMAVEAGAPVVFHCREGEADFIELVKPFAGKLRAGVMHCFGGNADFARTCLDWGFYVSFAGNVTFPKAKVLQEAAGAVPLDRLLVETDSPYLAPQPVRGKRCEPLYVLHTARFLAELKNVEFDELAAVTSANARKAFSISGTPDVLA